MTEVLAVFLCCQFLPDKVRYGIVIYIFQEKWKVVNMVFRIVKNSAFLEEFRNRHYAYATVESIRKTGLKKIFGPQTGEIKVSLPEGPDYPVFRVVVPEWKGGEKNEWEALQQCYRSVLQLAEKRDCKTVAIPLLEAGNPDFPASIDYKIAVDTIREFLTDHSLDVYLLVFRKNAAPMRRLRDDVEWFLSRNYSDWTQPRSPRTFADEEKTFDTIPFPISIEACRKETVPEELDDDLEEAIRKFSFDQEMGSAEPCDYAPAPQASFGYAQPMEADEEEICCSYEWCDEDHEELPRKAKPAAPEKAVSRQKSFREAAPKKAHAPQAASRTESSQRAMRVDRSTGSLPNLDWYLRDMDAGFSETLLKLIDRSGKKDSEIYNKANVSRQHFSKIRNNPEYKPTKPTAIAFAIALELDMDETNDLIGRAGYTLTRSSKFDVIIMYFIQHHNYNMFDINETLYEFDQSLLGA